MGLLLKESLGCHSWASMPLLEVGNKRQVIQKDDGHSRCHRGQRNHSKGGTLQFLPGCKHWRGALVHWEGQGRAETMALNLTKKENHHTHIKASVHSLCRPLHPIENCKAETFCGKHWGCTKLSSVNLHIKVKLCTGCYTQTMNHGTRHQKLMMHCTVTNIKKINKRDSLIWQ